MLFNIDGEHAHSIAAEHIRVQAVAYHDAFFGLCFKFAEDVLKKERIRLSNKPPAFPERLKDSCANWFAVPPQVSLVITNKIECPELLRVVNLVQKCNDRLFELSRVGAS